MPDWEGDIDKTWEWSQMQFVLHADNSVGNGPETIEAILTTLWEPFDFHKPKLID